MNEKIETLNILKMGLSSKLKFPAKVSILECCARDGLQTETIYVSPSDKIKLIDLLSETGLQSIEVTSFVSEKYVPQMKDNSEICSKISKKSGISYRACCPNMYGLKTGIKSGIKEFNFFSSPSETFHKKNINCSIEEGLFKLEKMIEEANLNSCIIRGYLSCAFTCPYEGDIDPERIKEIGKKMINLGCVQIGIADTIAAATPEKTRKLINILSKEIPVNKIRFHFHDLNNNSYENILVALEEGISEFDSCAGGLGGCPFVPQKVGNVCSENLVFLLDNLKIEHGINIEKLKDAGNFITKIVDKQNKSILFG